MFPSLSPSKKWGHLPCLKLFSSEKVAMTTMIMIIRMIDGSWHLEFCKQNSYILSHAD